MADAHVIMRLLVNLLYANIDLLAIIPYPHFDMRLMGTPDESSAYQSKGAKIINLSLELNMRIWRNGRRARFRF